MVGDGAGKARMPLSGNIPDPTCCWVLGPHGWIRCPPGLRPRRSGTAWWQMTTDNPAASLFAGGAGQIQKSLSQDPALRSIDQMWNANPLREVVPVDWAEIARALRTVWLRSLRKPGAAMAVVDLNQDLWRSALRSGRRPDSAGSAWPARQPANGPVVRRGDKRFAAPEWHANPVYRTLKEMYLLASDWLLKQGDAAKTWTRPSASASTSTCGSSSTP